jgi:hypothetical protein
VSMIKNEAEAQARCLCCRKVWAPGEPEAVRMKPRTSGPMRSS